MTTAPKPGLLFADILLVSDDTSLVRSLRMVLQAAGYIARSASNGESALDMIEAKPPDLIILDTHLPSLSGYDVARRLKANANPFIPIIMMGDAPHKAALSLNAGADDFLHKPFDNAEVLLRVRAMLRLKHTTDQLAELNATLERKVIERTRQLEEAHAQLRHAEKLASLGRLAASLAHEINNPLTGILSYAYLIKAELPPDSAVQEDMAMIERQLNAIAQIVQRLRDFSKPPRKERRRIVLNDVVEEVLALTGKELEKNRIRVVRQLNPHLPPVLASAEQMGEVLLNLVINARDAMTQGGTLTIRTNATDSHVQVHVTDTGEGIPPQVMERLFEPFFTTKGERGTGLGLSICYSIVQDHHGIINVESKPGQGTTFTVQLPLPPAPTNEAESATLAADANS